MEWEESRPRRPYGVPPDPDTEWEEYLHWMREWLGKEVRRGDKWFLITKPYFAKFEEWLGDKTKNPGPVDCTGIVDKDGDMLDRAAHDGNFKVIIGQVFTHICEKFGVKDDHPPIQRQIVNHEVFGNDVVERKVLRVFLAHSRDPSRSAWVPWLMSRGDRIFEVENHLRKCFDFARTDEIRMWHLWDETSMLWEPLLSKFDRPEDMYNLKSDTHRTIVYMVEPMNADGTWPRTPPRDPNLPKEKLGTTLRPFWGYHYGEKLDMGHTNKNPHRGICGLTNVENMCYMNCVIQVLAQIPSIRDFILTDTYIRDLNPDNPLSKNGDFAKQFGNLIKHIWSEKLTDITPETFKKCMGKYNDVYAGYGLHDAHEFLMYLLDGLHEDCNRIKKKPYIELDTDGKSDEVAAKESWDAFKARNESVAIDLFHYLTKSSLHCPECKKVSVTFEPQFGLSLPVPYITNNSVPLTFVFLDPAKKPLRLRVQMKSTDQTSWEEYKQQVSEITGVPVKRIRPGNMLPHRTWQEFWHNQKGLNDQMNGEFRTQPPLSLEKPEPPTDENLHNFLIEIYLLQADYTEITLNWKEGAPFYFHLPFYLPNLRKDIKYEEMYNMIYDRIKNRLPVPKDNWWEWKSPEDDEEEERVEKSFKSQKQIYRKPNLSNDTNVWEKNGKRYLFRIYNKSRDFYYENNEKEMKHITYGSIGILFHPKYSRDYIVPTFDPDKFVKGQADDHESSYKPAPKDIYTIEDCLREFHKTETLGRSDHWYCGKCKEHRQPTKDISIWSTPDNLIITLKRFEFNATTNDNKKIVSMVKFPVEGLDMDPYIKNPAHKKGSAIYDLYAIVNHSGTLTNGHYTSFVKHCEDQYWYFINDDKCCNGYPELLQTRQAYILYYKKRGTKEMTFTAPPEGVTEPFTTVRPKAVREQQRIDDRFSSMYGEHPKNKGLFRKANPAKGRMFDEYDPRRRYYDHDSDND